MSLSILSKCFAYNLWYRRVSNGLFDTSLDTDDKKLLPNKAQAKGLEGLVVSAYPLLWCICWKQQHRISSHEKIISSFRQLTLSRIIQQLFAKGHQNCWIEREPYFNCTLFSRYRAKLTTLYNGTENVMLISWRKAFAYWSWKWKWPLWLLKANYERWWRSADVWRILLKH